MIADVVGYSAMMGADEAGTLAQLNKLRLELFDPTLADHGGRIVKLMGDGTLVEFHSVVDAVNCALALQNAISERNAQVGDAGKIEYRIGVHLGDVIVQDDDIFGDGVNVAARIEPIAEPGGIALSEAAFAQVEGKIVAVFENAGPQNLKNIAHPVNVYRWPNDAPIGGTSLVQASTGLGLPDKPTIIVLPFENRSGKPEHDIFADGIAEDVIYGISRFSGMDVIGRYSSFSYKGQRPSVRELRRELGVRYVVEGSVRRGGDRVRISVELTDSKDGLQIWSNRYDRQLSDLIAIEDELVDEIVAALPGRILEAEKDRVRRKPPSDMTAYDHMIAGRLNHHKVSPDENMRAVQHLNKAIELDADYAEAYAWKACTLGQSLEFGFAEDTTSVEREALQMIDKALSLNEEHVECHRLLCEVSMMMHKLDRAEAHNRRALAVNSCDPRLLAQKGEVLTWQGKPDNGIPWIEKAMQLDPFGAPGRAHLLGGALHAAKRYDEAIKAYSMVPNPSEGCLAEAAACHARTGDEDGARALVAEALRQNPDFSVEKYSSGRFFGEAEDTKHLSESLKMAGLPD
jgi:adenylate cyclase